MCSQLKDFIYSLGIFIVSMLGICWIVSLSQLEETEKQKTIAHLISFITW